MAGPAGSVLVCASRLVTTLVLGPDWTTHALLLVAFDVTVVKLNGYTVPHPFFDFELDTPNAS